MWLWLRRRFLTGFFVTVPLFISVAALVWIFGIVDGPDDAPLRSGARPADSGPRHVDHGGRHPRGRRRGHQRHRQRLLQRAERLLLRVPVFRTIYAPVRQLVIAFSAG